MSRRLARGTALLGVQEGVTFVAALALHILIGRSLGAEGYGSYALILSVVTVCTLGALLGLPHALSRAAALAGRVTQALLGRALRVQLWIALGITAVGLAGAAPLAALMGLPELAGLLRLGLLSLPLAALTLVWLYAANGVEAFGVQALGQGAMTVLRLVVTAVALWLGYGLWGTAAAMPVAAALTLAVVWGAARRLVAPDGAEEPGGAALNRDALAFTGTFALVNLWLYVDPLLIAALTEGTREVGLFNAAATIGSAPEALFAPLILALFPVLAADADRAADRTRRAARWAWLIFCPLIVGSVWIAADLVTLTFGPAFAEAAGVLPLLVGAAFLKTLYYFGDGFLRASGRRGTAVWIVGLALGLNVALGLLLIPALGGTGAALASVLSGLAAAGLGLWPVRGRWSAADTSAALWPLPCALVAFAPFALLAAPGIWALVLSLACIGLYGLALNAVGVLSRAEIASLRGERET